MTIEASEGPGPTQNIIPAINNVPAPINIPTPNGAETSPDENNLDSSSESISYIIIYIYTSGKFKGLFPFLTYLKKYSKIHTAKPHVRTSLFGL